MSIGSRVGKSTMFMAAIVVVIAATCFSAGATDTENDRTTRSFKIGYDQGISARYYPNEQWGFGLLLSSPSWSGLYFKTSSDRVQERDTDSSWSSNRNTIKGAAAAIEVFRLIKRTDRFTINMFASVGGVFTTERRSDNYLNKYYDSGRDSLISRSDLYDYSTNTSGVIGQFGIMPGVTYGPISIEIRFGVEGSYRVESSPETATNQTDGTSSALRLIYPSSLLQSIIVLYEF